MSYKSSGTKFYWLMRPRWTYQSVEKEGICSWSKRYKLICEARWRKCHGCFCGLPNLYWWCNSWWEQQDRFRSLQKHYICYSLCQQSNASKLIWRNFIIQEDDYKKHAAKDFIREKKWKVLDWPSQPPDLNPIEHPFHLMKKWLKGKPPPKQTTTERNCGKSLKKHHKVIASKGYATKY